ncbi:MAG: radical SAM protein [Endomicrobiia bacterium]|nr:cobalamin-dependent protein [Endomicrobiaceae bacterium]
MQICCIYINSDGKFYNDFSNETKFTYLQVPLGISYISSSLKQAGHTTEMLLYTKHNYNIVQSINKKPSVIAISMASPDDFVLAQQLFLFDKLKKQYKDVKIILGGTAITLLSDNLWETRNTLKNIDALCIGEGEKAVVEYIKQVENNHFIKTDNLIIKDNNQWVKYDNASFIENLNELPYPDMDCWSSIVKPTDKIQIQISISRGCINQCIYCSNQLFVHKAKGTFYRVRNVDSVIKEVEHLCNKYNNLEYIYFQAESGILNLDYFTELCKALITYNTNKIIKVQFAIAFNFMPSFIDNNIYIADLIKAANISVLRFSVESGSLEIRKKLKRPYYSNEQIIAFCSKLRLNKVKYRLSAMYCFPFETRKTYKETIQLLQQCKPYMVDISFLGVFKGTPLFYVLKEMGDPKVTLLAFYRWITLKLKVYIAYKSFYELFFEIMPRTYKQLNLIFRIRSQYTLYKKNKLQKNIEIAKSAFDRQDYKEAIKYFNKIDILDNEGWIYGDRAIAKMKVGNYKSALKDFDRALQFESKEIYKQKKEECLNKIQKIKKAS